MSVYDTLIKRLESFIDTASTILQNLLSVIADKISDLDTEIDDASELNQTKKKLRQMLGEWNLKASSACSIENLQHILRHRYDYHKNRGSEFGILDDIDILCNSGVNILKDPPAIEWYLDINYPFWCDIDEALFFEFDDFESLEEFFYGLSGYDGHYSDGEGSPLNYSDGCYGYLIDLGFVIQFAIDSDLLSENEIKEIIRASFIPIHLDSILYDDVDSYNYLMLENELNVR